jgi:hypothetical protein
MHAPGSAKYIKTNCVPGFSRVYTVDHSFGAIKGPNGFLCGTTGLVCMVERAFVDAGSVDAVTLPAGVLKPVEPVVRDTLLAPICNCTGFDLCVKGQEGGRDVYCMYVKSDHVLMLDVVQGSLLVPLCLPNGATIPVRNPDNIRGVQGLPISGTKAVLVHSDVASFFKVHGLVDTTVEEVYTADMGKGAVRGPSGSIVGTTGLIRIV